VAHVKEADSDRSAAGPSEYGDGSNRNARRTYALRQEYLAGQKPGMRVLSHAIRWLQRTDPIGQPDNGHVSRDGSLSGRQRTPQRHPYSPFFPVLQYNQAKGLFFGGNFWDSRATGYRLRIPDAEQAQGPPVDTQEMGFPDTGCIAFRLSQAVYRPFFEEVWGEGSFDIKFPRETERGSAQPREEPLCLAGTRRRCLLVQAIEPAQI
jgi:hypothetical protein